MDTRLFTAIDPTTLSSGTSIGATQITPAFIRDREGNTISSMATFGTKAYGVIAPNTSREEQFSFTGISSGTLTGVSHVTMITPYTETSGLNEAHAAGEVVIIQTNSPAFYNEFLNKSNDETIVGTYTFNELPTLDSYEAPTNSAQLAPKGYVDAVVGGLANTDRLVVAGTAGETISIGQLIYFDTGTNNEWMKCDADIASSVDNVILGIAQGAGTDGNAISGGVLLKGLDSNQSGMTQGDPMYASNTAGAISSTPGTTEVAVGAARSATALYFDPRFPQQLTEAQQDLLDGITASATEINITDGLTGTTAQINEATTFFSATDITGAEAETLSSGSTSNADTLHTHSSLGQSFSFTPVINSASTATGAVRSSGFSDASEDILAVACHQSTTDVAYIVGIRMSEDYGASPYISTITSSALPSSSSASTTDVLLIDTDVWASEATGSEIRKAGVAVTISGTARYGCLGHDATNASLLVMYSTTKIAKFSGIAGTTITNLNDDVTLDTAVTQTGFVFDDANNRYVCLDTTANLLRKFDSAGTTITTAAYTINDGNAVGVCLIKDRYYIVKVLPYTLSAINQTGFVISLIPTTMTR